MRKLFFTISFLAIAAATFAGNNNTALTPEKRLDASIQDQVAFPSFLMDRPGEHTAEVHFSVNPDGTIAVRSIVSDELDLKENLIYQAGTFSVNTAGLDLKDTYKVVLRFNVL